MVSLVIVGSTAVWLLEYQLRRRKFGFQRGSVCGCTASPDSSPKTSIVFRARKGQRPEVVVKMR